MHWPLGMIGWQATGDFGLRSGLCDLPWRPWNPVKPSCGEAAPVLRERLAVVKRGENIGLSKGIHGEIWKIL